MFSAMAIALILYGKADATCHHSQRNEKNKEAIYNLGTAQYQQKKFEDAIESFKKSTENYSTKSEGIDAKMMKAASYHNLGNAYLLKQDASNAIEAYKNALKLNPTDLDTKYNLVFALQEKKKQDQNKDGKGDKNKDDKKEGKGDKNQNKDGNKKEGGDKGDEKKEGEGKDGKGDEKGQEEKPKPGQLSKEQAEKLLDALQNQEKKTQEKMQKIKGKPTPVKVEKDW